MSAASDRHEKMVADALDNLGLVTASRPSVGTEYADVLIEEYILNFLCYAKFVII